MLRKAYWQIVWSCAHGNDSGLTWGGLGQFGNAHALNKLTGLPLAIILRTCSTVLAPGINGLPVTDCFRRD